MLTTLVDLAFPYLLHLFFSTPHQVSLRDLPPEPENCPRTRPSSYLPLPSSLDSTQWGRNDSTGHIPVINSWCLQGFHAPLCAHSCWNDSQPSAPPPHLEGWQAFDNSSSSQKGQQSLLICWLWQMDPRIYPAKWFHFPQHIHVQESSQSINCIRKPTKLKTIAYN